MAKKSTAKKIPTSQALIDAAMAIAASDGWHALSMARVAEEAGVSLAKARSEMATIHAIIKSLIDQVDRNAIRECDHFQKEDTVRDRLFALLMARFDALQPYKTAFQKLGACAPAHPSLVLSYFPRLMISMGLMLDAAGVSSSGIMGLMHTKGLAVVYFIAFRTWLRDDTEDIAQTMAALDKGLSRAEMLALQLTSRTKSTQK